MVLQSIWKKHEFLHISAEFNRNIRHIHALSGELVALEVVVEQADRERALCFDVLPDDEIDRTVFDHFDVALGDVVNDDVHI